MTKIPNFVERDPEAIMAEVRAQMEKMLGREIHPAQFEQLVLNIITYREVLLLERFNAGMAQMLFQFSTAPILDYIAGLVAVERLPAANAGCMVEFTLVAGHGGVVLPMGTRVSTSDGVHIFEVVEDESIEAGRLTATVLVTAQTAGRAANGIGIGRIDTILDPYAWISSVENTTVTGGGSDVETDEALRERIRLAPSQFSTAGSRNSYIFHAMRANSSIIDVSVSSPVPGTVFIVPLCEGTEYEQVLRDIYDVCSAEDVRPLTDTVIVAAPIEKDYDITVDIIVANGFEINDVQSRVQAALAEFTHSKSIRLGQSVVLSHIVEVCRVRGVFDVNVISPSANMYVDYGEVAIVGNITVNPRPR